MSSSSSFDCSADERLLNDYQVEKRSMDSVAVRNPSCSRKVHAGYIITICCLLASNLAFVFSQQRHGLTSNILGVNGGNDEVLGRSEFAGLTYDTPMVFTNQSKYIDANETYKNEAWENINTSPIVVALTDEYADAHNIERSKLRFVWDESKGVYFIKLFHNLHCLKAMQKGWSDMKNGIKNEHSQWHFTHCLDSLRQDLLCQADDTPMPLVAFPDGVGYGQTRMCRNYDALVSWTQDLERNACYKRFSDSRGIKHKIEMYAFCPEDSPYYEVSQAYFKKWGHYDPYSEMQMEDESHELSR